MKLNKVHHVAVICSDYERSKQFYTDVLGMKIKSEHYREKRDSWKADCFIGDTYVVELALLPQSSCTSFLSRSSRSAPSCFRGRRPLGGGKRTRQQEHKARADTHGRIYRQAVCVLQRPRRTADRIVREIKKHHF